MKETTPKTSTSQAHRERFYPQILGWQKKRCEKDASKDISGRRRLETFAMVSHTHPLFDDLNQVKKVAFLLWNGLIAYAVSQMIGLR